MIDREEVKHLAQLARIEISEDEVDSLTKEIDSILGYVGQVQNTTSDVEKVVPKLRNVMRDDVVTRSPGQYTKDILANAPSTEGDYIKVKKILN